MPRYFNKFPKLVYSKGLDSSLVTNLLTRVDVIKNVLDNASLFYKYDIREGDTPEIIASKYYGDPELHWVVLLFNEVYDPFFDWPLTYLQFEEFIKEKYGSIASAKSTNHHYEKIIETTDSFTGETTKRVYNIDFTAYTALIPSSETRTFSNGQTVKVVTSKRAVDCYDYENELNDSKRTIRLVKTDLIPEIKRQFEFLMSA